MRLIERFNATNMFLYLAAAGDPKQNAQEILEAMGWCSRNLDAAFWIDGGNTFVKYNFADACYEVWSSEAIAIPQGPFPEQEAMKKVLELCQPNKS
jgi:hypothetical protein